jgi:hypothetical protein
LKTLTLSILNVLLFISSPVYGLDIWIPSTIKIGPTGDIKHKFPFPTKADPGRAFGSSSGYSAGFYPTIGGTISNFKRVFALTGERPNEKVRKLVETEKGFFLPANNNAGYRVVEQSTKSLKLAFAASIGPGGWAGLSLSFSISGSFAKGYMANRFAENLNHTTKLPKVEIPETLKQIKNWNPGDSLAYNKKMALGFNAGFGMSTYAKAGFAATVATLWNVAFQFPSEKENPQNKPMVKLSYSKGKDKSVSLSGSNLLANFSLSRLWGKSKSFEYVFDLSNKKKVSELKISAEVSGKKKDSVVKNVTTLMAYQEAIRGNLIIADMLSEKKGMGIKRLSENEKKSKTTKVSAQFKVPWVYNANFSKGKTFTSGQTKKLRDDLLVENWIGVFNQETKTAGTISKNMKRTNMFSGNYQQVTPLKKMDGNLIRRYSGNYKYYYTRQDVSIEKMQEELRKVREKIGFMKNLKGLEIKTTKVGKVGDLAIEVDVALSNVATDELINVAQRYGRNVLTNEAVNYMEGFFKNVTDAKREICTRYKTRLLKECIFTTRRQIKSAMKTAFNALIKMKKHRDDVDYKKFVQAYADFGKGLIENRFTLKTFLRMLRFDYNPNATGKTKFAKEKFILVDGKRIHVPYKVNIKIKGTHIAPVEKVLKSWE